MSASRELQRQLNRIEPCSPRAAKQPPAWEVYRRKSSPAAFVGVVYADDKASAIAEAIKERNIRPADQKRLLPGRARIGVESPRRDVAASGRP